MTREYELVKDFKDKEISKLPVIGKMIKIERTKKYFRALFKILNLL